MPVRIFLSTAVYCNSGLNYPPEDHKVFGESHVSSVCSHGTVNRLPRAKRSMYPFCEFTKTPRESVLTAQDCCLAYPTPSRISSGACLNFAGCDHNRVRSCCSRPQLKCKRSVGACSSFRFEHPKFRSISNTEDQFQSYASL